MLTPYLDDLNNGKRVILGSSSAQRQRIFRENLGLTNFEVIKSDFAEDLNKNCSVEDYVSKTCMAKLNDILENKVTGEWDIIVCSDTVISFPGSEVGEMETIFEKAADREHAISMLSRLSGKKHRVVTAVCTAIKGRDVHCFTESTSVVFSDIPRNAIEAYVDTGDAYGKAGAYGLQSLAASFASRLEGDYFNVMGFPAHRFAVELTRMLY
jgi:septum formation protein